MTAGKYRNSVRAPGQANYTSELIELGAMQARDGILLRVPAALHVAGTIHFEDASKPPQWMWLVATAADGHTRDTARIEGNEHAFAFDGLAPGEWTFSVATDLDDEFEEVKLHLDTDVQGLSLGFKAKPPEPPDPALNEKLQSLGYQGSDGK